jgi:hypothetical protein
MQRECSTYGTGFEIEFFLQSFNPDGVYKSFPLNDIALGLNPMENKKAKGVKKG